MADQTQIAEELYSFAQALVRKLRPRQHGWSAEDIEDAVQLLFLAGWQDYRDNGDLGLAKNRMRDRRKNLLRDRKARLEREAVLESNLPEPEEGQPGPLEQCRLRGNRARRSGRTRGLQRAAGTPAGTPATSRPPENVRPDGRRDRRGAWHLAANRRT
jgi:hypothetical protein